MMNRADENQQPGGEDSSAFNAAPKTADSVAAMIGTKKLKIVIITMPFVFMAVVALIIAVFGKPGRNTRAAAPVSLSTLNIGGAGGIVLPGNGVIQSMTLDGEKLALHVRNEDGVVIVIYDMTQDKIVKTIPIMQED